MRITNDQSSKSREEPGFRPGTDESGSAFIIVLWISFGLVSLALYFGNSMIYELRASDNRVSGISSEQAIVGAIRYVNSVLATQIANGSNGNLPDPAGYLNEAVSVGECHFWLIGRDTNSSSGPAVLTFGLVDEASKINLNSASSNMLASLVESLPRANTELAPAILDWRDTNGGAYQTWYSTRPQPYQSKSGSFESIDELRLLFGADMETLAGDDLNQNGVLDANEIDQNRDGLLDSGVLDCVTIYSREPNNRTNGAARINIRSGSAQPLQALLQEALGSTRANQILGTLGLLSTGPGGGGTPSLNFRSPIQLFDRSGMTLDEFAKIANDITVTNNVAFIEGRVNVNTASASVLTALPGLNTNPDLAPNLITYRETNPDKLTSVGWVKEALGQSYSSVRGALEAGDYITTQTFQFSADVAAVGPNGRGYRRMRFIIDTSEGTPKILYRQDLTQLGWALGKDIRENRIMAAAKK